MVSVGQNQTTKLKRIEHDRPKTVSVMKVFFNLMIETPSIAWRMRNYFKIKSKRSWYINRHNEAIELIEYSTKGDDPGPVIAFDAGKGKSRSLFNRRFSPLGRTIACLLNCRTFSIASHHELKEIETEDYQDRTYFITRNINRSVPRSED